MKHGIDLSHHNLKIDLMKLKAQSLVILKATEGVSYEDPKFEARFLGLNLAGVKRGAYHFYRTNKDPFDQADHFLSLVGKLDGSEVLALDYETCSAKGMIQTMDDLRDHKSDALTFLNHIHLKTGILPWFYTYHSVIQEVKFEPEFAKYPLWYARYTSVKPEPKQGPWHEWKAWQYSEKGVVDGATNDVDMNWIN